MSTGNASAPGFAVPGMHKLPFLIGDRRPCVAVSRDGQLVGYYLQPLAEGPGHAREVLTEMLDLKDDDRPQLYLVDGGEANE